MMEKQPIIFTPDGLAVMLPELSEGSKGGTLESAFAVGQLMRGIANIKDAIKDLEKREDNDVFLSLQGYLIKPDPIKDLPFDKRLILIMLEAQIGIYEYYIKQISGSTES